MGEFDWVDLDIPEHRTFLLTSANDMHKQLEVANSIYQKYEDQVKYIKELEKQVRLLQKTLDLVNKNKVLVRKVKKWRK